MIRDEIQDLIKKNMGEKKLEGLPFLRTIISELDLKKSQIDGENAKRKKANEKVSSKKAKQMLVFNELDVIRSMKQNALDCNNDVEASFFNSFLPVMMNDNEIRKALNDIEADNLGKYMGKWNSNPDLKGKADMGRVRELIEGEFLVG